MSRWMFSAASSTLGVARRLRAYHSRTNSAAVSRPEEAAPERGGGDGGGTHVRYLFEPFPVSLLGVECGLRQTTQLL
jgi:hypothetical protein